MNAFEKWCDEQEDNLIPVDIYSGFLGAGKTTLIKKMIAEAYAGEKVVLIENEFGEISIDGGFLKDAGIEITEMNSGCICCSLVGDFGESLRKVVEDFSPDRIIIEPSGVGKLSDVIKAVEGVAEDTPIALNAYTAVVDVKKYAKYIKLFGEFFIDQIQSAGLVVLSRTKDISEDELEKCTDALNEINPNALIITTDWDEINGKQILDVMESGFDLAYEDEYIEGIGYEDEEECCCGHHHDDDEEHEHHHHHHHEDGEECCCGHHHHHADEVFSSIGIETVRKFGEEEMNSILAGLTDEEKYGTVLRAKGIVPSAEGKWIHFDYVPDEYEVRFGSADVTGHVVVIGTNLNEDELRKLFKK
ncbi:MAG: GTP-binding protein [Oscillospiraceae bacterium]|nr:GTP-binding protein [Oscillospiraceae bacterium]